MKKLALLVFLFFVANSFSQKLSNEQIAKQITQYKNDVRGPYKDIRWFCTDGSIRQPKDPCPDKIGSGVQHARYKDDVVKLAETNHIYFGQILAYTNKADFWDAKNNHSRLKQYQLDKYLRAVDLSITTAFGVCKDVDALPIKKGKSKILKKLLSAARTSFSPNFSPAA